MSSPDTRPRFLAVLIYEHGDGWRSEEPRVYSVSHPEIAYQMALADGSEQRYGRHFLGLSRLEGTTEDVEPIACSQMGDAGELVIPKSDLPAFNDPRWIGVPFDEDELRQALTEPEYLMDIDGLDKIPWHTLTHAYGPALEVPKDIRRLTSSSSEFRQQALWQLSGSVYHQGTLYPATAAAVPFILRILKNRSLPDRGPICEFLETLAESAAIDTSEIEKAWQWRVKTFGETYSKPAAEMAAEEVAAFQAVRKCLMDNLELMQELAGDCDLDVARHARSVIDHLADTSDG